MKIPRILIIDDQLGGVRSDGRNLNREGLCFTVGIQDCTGDVPSESIEDPVAEGVFCRGQVVSGGQVENDLPAVLDAVRSGWGDGKRWALVLLDMEFKTGPVNSDGEPEGRPSDGRPEDYFGMTVLEALCRDPLVRDVPVVILSGMSRDQIERRFADYHVFEFVDKNEMGRDRLHELIQDNGLIEDERIAGRSLALLRCLRDARKLAKTGTANILLLGETGTGKELLARYIHENSPRAEGPYVTLFAHAVPDTMVDDLLFGHVKGAFTGASRTTTGKIAQAANGTLFIDEFGDLPPSVQLKLLRFLDTALRQTERIGAGDAGGDELPPVQVVLATNVDVESRTDFRQDLLQRIPREWRITIPPLRERREDIPILAEHFVHLFEQEFRDPLDPERRTISPEAMDALVQYGWEEGNVRELRGVIRAAVCLRPKLRILSASHLRLPTHVPPNYPDSDLASAVQPGVGPAQGAEITFAELLDCLNAVEFSAEPGRRGEWAGRLPELRIAYANMLGRLVRAALLSKREPTPTCPEGEINFTGAMGFLNGRIMSSPAARDLLKRLFKFARADRDIEDGLEMDSLVEEYHREACEKRSGKGR